MAITNPEDHVCPRCGEDAYGFIDASGAGIYKCGSTDAGFDPEHPAPYVTNDCLMRQLAQRNEQIALLKADLGATRRAWDDGARSCTAEIEALKADLEEQCRLLGISGSKEAKLLTEIAALKAAKARAGEAWRRRHPDVGMGWVPDPIEVLNAYFAEEAEHE